MDSKDARESLEEEAGGGAARCRCSTSRRAAAGFIIQSLLTAICAALSLNMFLSQKHDSKDTGIYLQMLSHIPDPVPFTVIWNQSVYLKDEKQIMLPCAGPYMVYLWASTENYGAIVNISLQQENQSFHLQTLRDNERKQMQTVLMLSDKSEVTVKVELNRNGIEFYDLFLGLHYMLGNQCFPHPLTYS